MVLYHYPKPPSKEVQKYEVQEGTTIEQVFAEVSAWPGTKLLLVKG